MTTAVKLDRFAQRFFDGVPRYRWLETLGRGAAGIVYKALDLELDEIVAMKVLAPDSREEEEALVARFRREFYLNRKVRHPNIARIHEFGVSGDYPYITMEFVDGVDLWTLVQREKRIPPHRAVSILRQIARGSAAFHKHGIVHRDLKSQNVIVNRDGGVAILDFGLARGSPNEAFTLHTIILGTPQYMSPEQAQGKPLDARSDIYSIGCIAFEALTGKPPFTGDSPIAIAMKHVYEPVPDTLAQFRDVSRELRAIVTCALAKDPKGRFASALDLEAALAMLDPRDTARREVSPERISAEVDSALDAILLPEDAPARPARPIRSFDVPEDDEPPATLTRLQTTKVTRRSPVVLVAHPDVRDLVRLATAVCRAGCRTVEVSTGEEVHEALQRRSVDLVLMDTQLAEPDGFEVTRQIRLKPQYAALPILLLAPQAEGRHQMALGMQAGAVDVILRPIPPGALPVRLWSVLRRLGFEPKERGDSVIPKSRRRR